MVLCIYRTNPPNCRRPHARIAPCPRRDAGALHGVAIRGPHLPDRGRAAAGTLAAMVVVRHCPVPTSRRRGGPSGAGRRRPSPAGSRPSYVAHVAPSRHRGHLAPTTRTSPAAATRSKLGDVGGNGRHLPDRGQPRHRPVPTSRRRGVPLGGVAPLAITCRNAARGLRRHVAAPPAPSRGPWMFLAPACWSPGLAHGRLRLPLVVYYEWVKPQSSVTGGALCQQPQVVPGASG
jgi:hypothetical protein